MIRNIILLILLVVQCGILVVIDAPWSVEQARSETVARHEMATVPVSDVGWIEVSDNGQTLTLALQDGVWTVGELHGYPTAPDMVENALAELADFDKADFRSDKRIMHEDFEVDDKKGLSLRLMTTDKRPIAHLIVGSRDLQGVQGTFVRRAEEDAVFVARSQRIGSVFPTDPYMWVSARLGVMDVTRRDQARSLELRDACSRLEVEGRRQKLDDKNRPVVPEAFETVRFVYERVPAPEGSDDPPTWKVVEPAGKDDLVLDNNHLTRLVTALLSTSAYTIEAAGWKDDRFGLADDLALQMHVKGWFKEPQNQTTRVLRLGTSYSAPPVRPGLPGQAMAYARVEHPGDKRSQSFVFGVPAHMPKVFLRNPETMVKVEPIKPPDNKKERDVDK